MQWWKSEEIDFLYLSNHLGNRKTHLWIIFHSELMENLMFPFYFPAWGCHVFHWNTLLQTTSETTGCPQKQFSAHQKKNSLRILKLTLLLFLVSFLRVFFVGHPVHTSTVVTRTRKDFVLWMSFQSYIPAIRCYFSHHQSARFWNIK